MNPTAKQVLISLVASAAAVGAYHVSLAPRTTGGGSGEPTGVPSAPGNEGLPAVRRELFGLRDELRAYVAAGATATGTGEASAAAVASLIARIQALEERLIGTSATSGDRALRHLPPGVGERPSAWTEEQIASFRELLDAVELRRAMDKETTSIQQMVRRADPNVAPADETAATSLIVEFMRKVRVLFASPTLRDAPEEWQAANQRAREMREKVLADLKQLLRADALEKVGQMLPDFDTEKLKSTNWIRDAGMEPGM